MKIVDGLIQDPPPEMAAPWDWLRPRERLGRWRWQIESGREMYRDGQEQTLRVLYGLLANHRRGCEGSRLGLPEAYRELGLRVRA